MADKKLVTPKDENKVFKKKSSKESLAKRFEELDSVNNDEKDKDNILVVKHLKQYFPISTGFFLTKDLKAVDDVTFSIKKGETLGLVGESGCGKTTLGRSILHLYEPTDGLIYFNGKLINDKNSLSEFRQKAQVVFQDPYSSLDPRMTVEDIIAEPLDVYHSYKDKEDRRNQVLELMKIVGLTPEHLTRYAHEFSGGQRQRIGIARALALKPEFIVCDEPVSALDVSIQAQVINTFEDLKKKLGLTYLFVAHNLLVVKHISDRIAVMYLGHLVELAKSEELFDKPLHPYTQSLLSAIPIPDPRESRSSKRIILSGDIPSPLNAPSGCPFRTRCSKAIEKCATSRPILREIEKEHFVACHLYGDKN